MEQKIILKCFYILDILKLVGMTNIWKKCNLSKSNTNIRFSENMKFPLKRGKKTTKTSPLLSDYTPPPHFIPIPITQLFTFLRPPHVHLNII